MTDHTDTDAAGTEALRQRLSTAPPREVRAAIRSNAWTGTTHGLARGHVHANIAIVPEAYALDFMRFCQRNPKPCPILDVTDTGDPEFARIAPGSDIRTDLSGYSTYRDGVSTGTAHDITDLWRGDLVAFAMGCSLSF